MIRNGTDEKEDMRVDGDPMNEIAELERRIAYAIERISKGVEAMDQAKAAVVPPAPQADAPQPVTAPEDHAALDALRAELEEERLANAQLEERVRTLKRRQEVQAENLLTEQAVAREKLAQLDSELTRLRKANDQLQASNEALRAAQESGISEPHLVNKSMMTELEAMRAARRVDRAEAEAIKVALVPLLRDPEAADDTADDARSAQDQNRKGSDDATGPEGTA